MESELQVTPPVEQPTVSPDQLAIIKNTIAKGATDEEVKLYIYDCVRRGVHPLDRLIHFTKRGGRYVPITSIDFMRMQADRTGSYAGYESQFTGTPGTKDFACQVTVKRIVNGSVCTWTGTARWSEYYPGDQMGAMWQKMPHNQLEKCAEALALRRAFPALHGLYAKEEMDQATQPDKTTLTQKLENRLKLVETATFAKGSEPSMIEEVK